MVWLGELEHIRLMPASGKEIFSSAEEAAKTLFPLSEELRKKYWVETSVDLELPEFTALELETEGRQFPKNEGYLVLSCGERTGRVPCSVEESHEVVGDYEDSLYLFIEGVQDPILYRDGFWVHPMGVGKPPVLKAHLLLVDKLNRRVATQEQVVEVLNNARVRTTEVIENILSGKVK